MHNKIINLALGLLMTLAWGTLLGHPGPPAHKHSHGMGKLRNPLPTLLRTRRHQRPTTRHVWVSGYWSWQNEDWLWVDGGYVLPVTDAPPQAKLDLMPPSTQPNRIWVSGYWSYKDKTWRWVTGHYQFQPDRTARWTNGLWERVATGWIWRPGHWVRGD